MSPNDSLALRVQGHWTDWSPVSWGYDYLKHLWRSQSVIKARVHLRNRDDPQEPLPNTLAADEDIAQEWDEYSYDPFLSEQTQYRRKSSTASHHFSRITHRRS